MYLMYGIKAGNIRDDSQGAMQVFSGGYGHDQVHFVAPDSNKLSDELEKFLP